MSPPETDLPGRPDPLARVRRSLAGLYEAVARDPVARVFDIATLGFVAFFHRVIGAKYLYAPLGFDEHFFLWEGFSTARGMVPYRDFQEFKPPMIFVINALGIKLFGLDAMAYRHIFLLLSLFGFMSLAICLLSRGVNRWLTGAVTALMINHYFDSGLHDSTINNAESLGLEFFVIGCGILLIKTRWDRLQLLVGAAFLTLAPLSKEPMAFPTVAAWLAILLLHSFESSRSRAARRFVLFTTLGVGAVLTTWLAYMLATRSLGSYIEQLKLNIAYTKNYAYQLGWFPRNSEEGELLEGWKRLRETYVNYAHLGVFVPFFGAALALWPGRRKVIGVAALACFAGAIHAVTIGHGYIPHYYIMAMSGTFFFTVIGVIALDAAAKRAGADMRRWIGLGWAATALVALGPRFSDEKERYGKYKPLDPPVNQSHVAFVKSHSRSEDRIWTLGEPLLYVYSDRLCAVRVGGVYDELIQYYEGDTDERRLASVRQELIHNRPKLVVFGDDAVGYERKQRYMNALVLPFLRDYGYTKIDDKVYARP